MQIQFQQNKVSKNVYATRVSLYRFIKKDPETDYISLLQVLCHISSNSI